MNWQRTAAWFSALSNTTIDIRSLSGFARELRSGLFVNVSVTSESDTAMLIEIEVSVC
jgi:hypothetical protein